MFAMPYATLYDKVNAKKKYKEEINFIYNWAGKPKNILDLGCGTASYWKYYPKDVSITGIEKSRDMIRESKENIINYDATEVGSLFTENRFDCITALFDVVNYIENNTWWKYLPLSPKGYFIFDVWDFDKIMEDGFHTSTTENGEVKRIISPGKVTTKKGKLSIKLTIRTSIGRRHAKEEHTMYLHRHKDIVSWCKKKLMVVDTKVTDTWQKWYKMGVV